MPSSIKLFGMKNKGYSIDFENIQTLSEGKGLKFEIVAIDFFLLISVLNTKHINKYYDKPKPYHSTP